MLRLSVGSMTGSSIIYECIAIKFGMWCVCVYSLLNASNYPLVLMTSGSKNLNGCLLHPCLPSLKVSCSLEKKNSSDLGPWIACVTMFFLPFLHHARCCSFSLSILTLSDPFGGCTNHIPLKRASEPLLHLTMTALVSWALSRSSAGRCPEPSSPLYLCVS